MAALDLDKLEAVARENIDPFSVHDRASSVDAIRARWRKTITPETVLELIARIREQDFRLRKQLEHIRELEWQIAEGCPHPPDKGSTHHDHCWDRPGHHNCAVQKIRELEELCDKYYHQTRKER